VNFALEPCENFGRLEKLVAQCQAENRCLGAIDQLTRSKDKVRKIMTAAQLADAERELRERLSRWRRVQQPITAQLSSHCNRGVVA